MAEYTGSRQSNENDDQKQVRDNKQNDEPVKNITQINADHIPRKITMINENIPRKNDVHKNKNISQTKLDNRPWKIVLQNIPGLLTENLNKKLKMTKEYAKDEKIVIMNFTETWYKETIKEEANIEGYNIFRCDRK